MAVANRYARALADVVGAQGDYHAAGRELADFAAAYRSSADLREVLESPAVALDGKLKVLDAILAKISVSRHTANFLRVLVAHFRVSLLDEILPAFERISNDRMGIVEVKILSASEIPEDTRQALRARFEQVTQKRVTMEFQLQANLLGGVLARIRSTLYDGSVRGQLERIREKLTAG